MTRTFKAPVFKSYDEFWPYYLEEHAHPTNRRLHVYGTTLALLTAVALGIYGCWLCIPLTLVLGYGFSWVGHFFVQRNRPATFKYPWWSFISDFKMMYLFYRGKL